VPKSPCIVRDASSAAIPGAKVSVTNQDTAADRATKADGSGLYSVPALPPGRYRMTVSADGFQTQSRDNIKIETGQTASIDFDLKIGASKDVVTVNGSQIYINQSDATVSTVIDRQFVENTPLNGRTLQSLMTLVPGVSIQPGSGQVGYKGEITVDGQRTESNYFTVDGVSANSGAKIDNETGGAGYSGAIPGMTIIGTTQSMVSLDALQEFRASTSTYAADQGRTPGGQFAFTTRSGANSIHGTLFDFFRNNDLDAANWFNHYYNPAIDVLNTPNDFPKSAEHQNDFGGTLGGPVNIPHLYHGKDKTFFFFSYEGMRLIQPVPPSDKVVPDKAMRLAAPAVLQPFLNAYSIQNGSELTQSPGLANYILVYSEPSSIDAASVRIEHSFGSKLQLFGRYAYTPSGGWYFNDLPIHDNIRVNVQSVTLGATSMITPTQTNEFRFNFTYNTSGEHEIASNFGGATPISVSIVDGPNGQPLNPIGSQLTFRTYFTTGGKAEFELEGNDYDQYQYNVVDTYHWTHGAHAVRFGVDWRRISTLAIPSLNKEEVQFASEAQVLANAAGVVENVPHSILKSEPVFTNLSAFVQDEWKVAPRLSLSLGLRWDVNPPPGNEMGYLPYTLNQISNLATATLAPTNTPLYKTQWTGFAPRFGLAYQLGHSSGHETVLRAGAGLFYDLNSLLASSGFSTFIGFDTSVKYAGVPFPLTPSQLTLPPVSLATPYNQSVLAFDPNLRLPYTIHWNVALEQRLGRSQTLTASYVGSLGQDLLTEFQYAPQALGNTNFASGSDADVVANRASSSYDALQVKFQRDIAHGLQVLASYTWSHSIDNASNNFLLNELLRASSDFDIRQNFQAAFTYNVPGSYSNPILAGLLKYWGLDSHISARTAIPFDLVGSNGTDPVTQATLNYEPNLVPGQPVYLSGPQLVDGQMINTPGGRVVNINAFSAAPANVNGDTPRNFVRGFGASQVDMAVRRDFSFNERLKLQFRAEAFNVFNHPQFGAIDGTLTDGNGQFGWASTTLNNEGGALSPLYAQGGPRSLQLSLKLRF
jgi:Carboxypeptidase regulatory-like domain/TonB dependent receptor